MSTIQKAEREVLVDTDDMKDSNQVTGKIFGLELDSLSEKIVFPKCKGNVEQLDEDQQFAIRATLRPQKTEMKLEKLRNSI